MESGGNSADTEVRAIPEATLRLYDTIKTKVAPSVIYIAPPGAIFTDENMTNEVEKDGMRKEGEHRIVVGMVGIGLLRRSGNVEKGLRKPKVVVEQNLMEPESESEELRVFIRDATTFLCPLVRIHGLSHFACWTPKGTLMKIGKPRRDI